MSAKFLKLGFIGGGLNSAIGMTHKIAAQMDDKFIISAGCFSRNSQVNEETAAAWGVETLYCNWQELLACEKNNLDAVVVVTPTPTHKEIIIKAVKSGYNVICDKTLAVSSKDSVEIQKAVEQHKAFLAITYNYTGYPMLRELRDMITKGKLGKLTQIHIEMPQESFIRLNKEGNSPKPQDWRMHDIGVPIVSLDLGSHLHNMIYFISGEKIERVMAITNSFGSFKQVKDNVICLAEYSNDLVCNIWYSKAALGDRNGLKVRVYGEKGSSEWYQNNPEILIYNDSQGGIHTYDRASIESNISCEARYTRFKAGHPAGFVEAFANHYYDIAEGLLKHQKGEKTLSPYIFGVDHALEGIKMLEAINNSATNNKWTEV